MKYYRYKIVLFGDADSGKTELRENYTKNLFDDANKMTLGVEFAFKTIEIDKAKVRFEIWDLSSEESFKDLLPSFVLSAKGAILIIKMQNDATLTELRDKVLNVKGLLSVLKNGPIPIVVLGIRDASVVIQSKYSRDNLEIAKNIGVELFSVCSITAREVIESIFQRLGRVLVNKTLAELAKRDGEDYKSRIKVLVKKVENGANSPEVYQQILDNVEHVKIIAILRTKKHERNEKAIVGFVFAIREYYRLTADPNYPFNKDDLKKKIKALYKLIYNELLKPPNIPVRWALDDKRRIVENIRKVLGEENTEYFIKKYKVNRLLRLKFEDTKYYKYYAICWTIAFIVLLTIFFVQRL